MERGLSRSRIRRVVRSEMRSQAHNSGCSGAGARPSALSGRLDPLVQSWQAAAQDVPDTGSRAEARSSSWSRRASAPNAFPSLFVDGMDRVSPFRLDRLVCKSRAGSSGRGHRADDFRRKKPDRPASSGRDGCGAPAGRFYRGVPLDTTDSAAAISSGLRFPLS